MDLTRRLTSRPHRYTPDEQSGRSGARARGHAWSLKALVVATLVFILLPAFPALASHEPTLIYENDVSSTSAVSSPETDGEYVVWRASSVSVHQRCGVINKARFDDHAPTRLFDVAKSASTMAVDDGRMIVATAGAQCVENDPESQIPGGVFLVNIASGQSWTLTTLADHVTDVAIDYPYVAWLSNERIDDTYNIDVYAMNLSTIEYPVPVAIASETVSGNGRTDLHLQGDTVYWARGYGESSVGDVARAQIGGSLSYTMSLHGTTDVLLAGDIMVTLTEGRPLLHNRTNGEKVWLADGEVHNLASDGRYVFWSPDAHSSTAIMGFDTVTNSRFTVWQIQADNPGSTGWISDVAAGNGAIVWNHWGYNQWMTAIHGSMISDLVPSAYQPNPGTTSPEWTYYPETGHYLANDFREFWNDNGGLPVFGYPMTEEFDYLSPETGNAHAAQMTERQRFEWHPENIGTPYAVLLGRLGETILQEQGRDWTTFDKAAPTTDHYFAETGHAIAPEFYAYWDSHGLDLGHNGVSFDESLALFGYPLSEPMMETNADGDTVLTQYFERAVFEYHPDNLPASQVLLRRLGAELMQSWGW